MKPHFSQDIWNELKQDQETGNCLFNKILYSKRLLIDHVEALDKFQMYVRTERMCEPTKTKLAGSKENEKRTSRICGLVTARNTFLICGGALLQRLFTPKALRLTMLPAILLAGSFTAIYSVKNVFILRNKMFKRQLDNLILTINAFSNCLLRNIAYFKEALFMKQLDIVNLIQTERAWDCITAAKGVTEILYDATRNLETKYSIASRFAECYFPMEELRDCEYFKRNVTDFSSNHIKVFYNIFAYAQSQFLLCLALIIASEPSVSILNKELIKIDCLIQQVVQDEENHFLNLPMHLKKSSQIENEALNNVKTMPNRAGPIAMFQDCSLKLSARMVAVACECLALDISLQKLTDVKALEGNTKSLTKVANSMCSIENTLSVCYNDFQRFMFVYNNFMKREQIFPDKVTDDNEITTNVEKNTEDFLQFDIEPNFNNPELKDDFFAYVFDEKSLKNSLRQTAPECDKVIGKIEERITKNKFRPVLKQLKDRIKPIKQEMLEKERKVLASKGINIDDLLAKGSDYEIENPHNIRHCDEEIENMDEACNNKSDDSDDFTHVNRSTRLRKYDKYAEMRNLLAQKQSLKLFNNASAPRSTAGNEIILE